MSDGRAAVRVRNGVAILDAALETLVANPDAGMGEIAAAAGLGRATLYRHYETREDLLAALHARVRTQFQSLLVDLEREPEELERFVAGLLRLREGWASIAPQRDARRVREVWAPMRHIIGRLQVSGTIDRALDPDWVLASFRGQLRAVAEEIDAGRLSRDAAPALVVRGFLHGVS